MSRRKFDFEQVHPSKKAAFADGALTATLVITTLGWLWSQHRSDKAFLKGWTAAQKSLENETDHPKQ